MTHTEFIEHAKTLKQNGFRVLVCNDPSYTYGYAVKERTGQYPHIAYFQYDRLEGMSVSTVHIPCLQAGTGYSLDYDHKKSFAGNIEIAATTTAPRWARRRELDAICKYLTFDAFMDSFRRRTLTER